MEEQVYTMLKELASIPSPSGYEEMRRNVVMKHWSEHTKNITIDKIGNIIAHVKSKGESNKKIIVSAHLDEIGGTIRKICDDGRLKFSKRGSYEDGLVSGKKIKIRTSSNKWINGIIEGRSFHAINEKYRSKYPNLLEDSYIYLGAESKDEIVMWDIHVGAPFVFDEPFGYLGNSDNIISGKSLDDLVNIGAKEFAKLLLRKGVETRPFFRGMHEQPVFHKMGLFKDEKYPITEKIYRRGFYLPSGQAITDYQIESHLRNISFLDV